MQFNSLQYALFLPVAVIVYRALPGHRPRLWWLLGTSYLFYATWDWRFLGLLAFSTAVDFSVAILMDRSDAERRRRWLLATSVVVQLTILGFFKYFDFFIGSATDVLSQLGIEYAELGLRFLLPVGISFYTFQSMSYTIDVYRRRIDPCRDPVLFAVFVAFFPQLVAGPIERAEHLLPQLARPPRPLRSRQVESGLGLILLGLVRKVVIADTVAPIANDAFADPAAAGTIGMIVGVLAFALQIYGDFAAYTDIARGSARLLGVELTHNFRQPYLARSITAFWRRWHISLSRWLRDYLYVPLGGNRLGRRRTYLNLLVTMVLGGLWHGAAWTFVAWGALHGLFLAYERAREPRRVGNTAPAWTPRQLGAATWTFALVCLAWIFFRATSLGNAFDALGAIGSLDGGWPPVADLLIVGAALAVTLGIDLVQRDRPGLLDQLRQRPVLSGAVVGLALVLVIVYSGQTPVPFIYFQF